MKLISTLQNTKCIMSVCFCVSCQSFAAQTDNSIKHSGASVKSISQQLNVGDVVFIHVTPLPFEKVSSTTLCWVNHVGVVVSFKEGAPIIAESTFPFSRTTSLSRFIARSEKGRFAFARLNKPLMEEQKQAVWSASKKRLGILYDTGFNLNSKHQFCSRFVREVLNEATGESIGKVENFKTLLASNPDTDLTFWRVWYFGNIPWERQTVSPASIYNSTNLNKVFDGTVI